MRLSLYTLSVLLLCASLSLAVDAAESPSPKRIRVIFGYENIGRWEQQFTEALAEIVLSDSRVIFQTDYLPLDAEDSTSFALFSTLEQIRSSEADAVIAVRAQASKFVHQWGETFFPGVPRIYVAPDSSLVAANLEAASDGIVPSAADAAARETLALLPTLLPDLEHIYLLSGDGAADATYLARIQNAVEKSELPQTFHYLVGLTPLELAIELNNAAENSAAVFGLYSRDSTGQMYRGGDVSGFVSELTEIPLFGLFDGVLDSGVIGGSMTSARLYALKAAELTLALLFDEAVPANLETPTGYFFDGVQLSRFGINRDLLPATSKIINDNPSLLQQYRWQFYLGIAVFVTQLLLITALSHSLRRLRTAEKEREYSTAAMQEAQRIAHLGSWEMDLDSNRFVWSPELYRIQGLDPQSPPPTYEEHSKLFTPQSWELLSSSLSHTTESGEPYQLELETVRPDGKHGWLSARGEVARDNDGNIIGLRGTAIDTTELHAINEQLRRSQKMEVVGQLTGGIAHDFNNILAVIMGYLELVKRQSSSDKKISSSVDHALNGVMRGTALVNKLLGFSRSHSNKTSLTSVNTLVEDIQDLLVKSLTVAVKIETRLSENIWQVDVDPGDLENAILNLTLNARDAMPEGGKLSIETVNKVLDADFVNRQPEAEVGEYVLLSVNDTGTGMTPEVREKVLEPFFSTKPEGKGTGLGLSMVYGFVKRSGGFITIYSEPGNGTSINLFLPRGRRTGQIEASTIDSGQLPRGEETVLVVDDEEELANLAVANLESLGYAVLTAFDGKSALAVIEETPNIDLLFSDVIMPGKIDGYILGTTVRKTYPSMKILLTSGFTRRTEGDATPKDPMTEEFTHSLLRKPYSRAELARAVRKALDENGE